MDRHIFIDQQILDDVQSQQRLADARTSRYHNHIALLQTARYIIQLVEARRYPGRPFGSRISMASNAKGSNSLIWRIVDT